MSLAGESKFTKNVEAELVSLWNDILGVPPPNIYSQLWDEHVTIYERINSISKFHQKREFIDHDRSKSINEFLVWSENVGIQHEYVAINGSSDYLFLEAQKSLSTDSIIVNVPRSAILCSDLVDNSPALRKIFEDKMINSMDNVGLVMILAHEMLINDSHWLPFIRILPTKFSTPLFYTADQLQLLKPSPVFQEALNFYRSIVRQYVYFYLQILSCKQISSLSKKNIKSVKRSHSEAANIFSSSPFTPENFSFELYLRCVSIVSTRINMIPSIQQQNSDGTKKLIPALIPFIDIANHETIEENPGSVYFDVLSDSVKLLLHKNISPSHEICIYYGNRNNSKFLLHNGFIPYPSNPHNNFELKIGMPTNSDSNWKHQFLKDKLNFPSANRIYTFYLPEIDQNSTVEVKNISLWEFSKVFVAKSPTGINSRENECSAIKFLFERFKLVLRAYKGLDALEPNFDDNSVESMILRLKFSEYKILRQYFAYYEGLLKNYIS